MEVVVILQQQTHTRNNTMISGVHAKRIVLSTGNAYEQVWHKISWKKIYGNDCSSNVMKLMQSVWTVNGILLQKFLWICVQVW